MSSHRNSDMDMLDNSLRRSLKNWVARQPLPLDGKERLLESAALASPKKTFKLPKFLFMNLSQNSADLAFNRFAKATAYSLQAGAGIQGLNVLS